MLTLLVLYSFDAQSSCLSCQSWQSHVAWHTVRAALVNQRTAFAMQGVSDPEKKRKVIGAGFIRVFDEFATKLKSEDRIKPRFLVQVTTPL
jgi:GMP synthase PP-ATPase subunit